MAVCSQSLLYRWVEKAFREGFVCGRSKGLNYYEEYERLKKQIENDLNPKDYIEINGQQIPVINVIDMELNMIES